MHLLPFMSISPRLVANAHSDDVNAISNWPVPCISVSFLLEPRLWMAYALLGFIAGKINRTSSGRSLQILLKRRELDACSR